jgi:hypothetical protein
MRKSALIVPKVSNRLVAEQNTSFFVFCIDATPPLSPFFVAAWNFLWLRMRDWLVISLLIVATRLKRKALNAHSDRSVG